MKSRITGITIIGAGLTGLTLAYYLMRAGKDVLIVEKENRAGGVINTLSEQGFTFEAGPNTGVIGTTEIVQLFEDLKNMLQVEPANTNVKNRWIWKKGQWHALPLGFIKAVTTPLFSIKDKFRILAEPFRKPGTNPDETVAGLVLRRLGRTYLDYAVDPFISGIYAGDPERLITRFALPKLYNLEQNYGSFIKGAIKKRSEPKTGIEKKVSREVFSVRGGLIQLIDILVGEVGSGNILTGSNDLMINPAEDGYICRFINPENEEVEILSKMVITTITGNNLPSVLSFLSHEMIDAVASINYAKVVQVVACYHKWDGIKLDAFGGLIPSKENRNCLGILFPSALFDGRAPQGGAILSVFMGGIKKPEIINKNDNELELIALSEIKETLKCSERPDLMRIFRYENAIPQYEISSGKRLEAIEKIQHLHPGLILAGNIRDGIGMADRVKQARQLADSFSSE